jgi:DNA-binding response OmpR family regulator
MRVLIVEDDPLVADGVKLGLEQTGFVADTVSCAELAESCLRQESFDLAIVDLGLPKVDGLELIRRVRRHGLVLPVLILTARDSLEERVDGFEFGADDFMVKPFQLPELVARVRALIRRSNSVVSSELSYGPLWMHLQQHSAKLAGSPLELTPREWSILEYMMLKAPQVVSKDRLVQSLGGWSVDMTPNAVEVHVSRLRSKLEHGSIKIHTVRGIGYRLDALDS